MTTINTIEDLIQILDEHPEWNEALRVRMLSRELLNLPQAFAEFAERTERRLAVLETTLAEFIASTNQRLAALEEGQVRLEEGQARLEERQTRLEERQTRLEEGQVRIENDMSPLKAAHAPQWSLAHHPPHRPYHELPASPVAGGRRDTGLAGYRRYRWHPAQRTGKF